MNHTPNDDAHGRHERRTALTLARRHALATDVGALPPPAEGGEDSLQLRDLMRIFLKRKWTILAIFSVSALFSVVMTYLAPPVYRASTTIQIERFTPRVLDFKEVSPGESGDYWSDGSDFYFTNYELLKSRTLAERAVEDIGLRKGSAGSSGSPDIGPPGASRASGLRGATASEVPLAG